jgi:hypothetical protein
MPKHCPPMHEIAVFANGQDDPIAAFSDGQRAFSCHNQAALFAEKKVSFTAHILPHRVFVGVIFRIEIVHV